MQTFQDDLSRKTRVRWYFTKPGTPMLGKATFAYPQNWELRNGWSDEELGEVEKRAYRNGTPLFEQAIGEPCGTDRQWAFGALTTDDIPPYYPASTIPFCCPGPLQAGQGPLAIAGDDVGVPCLPCEGLPNRFFVKLVKTFGLCPGLDGLIIPLFRDLSPCAVDPGRQPLARSPSVLINGSAYTWLLFCGDPPFDQYVLEAVSPDCSGSSFVGVGIVVSTCSPFAGVSFSDFQELVPSCPFVTFRAEIFE